MQRKYGASSSKIVVALTTELASLVNIVRSDDEDQHELLHPEYEFAGS